MKKRTTWFAAVLTILTGRYQNRFGFESQPMQRYVCNELEFLVFSHLIETDEMQPIRSPSYPTPENIAKQGLPISEITLGEIFRASGYATALVGKWHLGYGEDNHPLDFGFDHYYGFLEAFSLYAPEDDRQRSAARREVHTVRRWPGDTDDDVLARWH